MAVEYLKPNQQEFIDQCEAFLDRARSGESVGAYLLEWGKDEIIHPLEIGSRADQDVLASELFALGAEAIATSVTDRVIENIVTVGEDDPEGAS
jgi:hypothetical protein